ncbi:MAG: hypothetical protein IPK03_01695 [Bacteroidetes bacterium]|nr:hypothetical protein [Bacteroidota bacterium]
MKTVLKNLTVLLVLLFIATIIYLEVSRQFQEYYLNNLNKNSTFKYNEFGDFIGGILNPLFTLLSTISIIFLTYIVAKNDEVKADKAIETQKRITLNQMRQAAFESLVQKTNMYLYEFDKLSIYEAKNKLTQMVLTNIIKKENAKNYVTVWLIILSELENFTKFNYLFSDLFKKEDFQYKHQEFINITAKLSEEQNEYQFIKTETLECYINIQKDFLTFIGNYIYSEF